MPNFPPYSFLLFPEPGALRPGEASGGERTRERTPVPSWEGPFRSTEARQRRKRSDPAVAAQYKDRPLPCAWSCWPRHGTQRSGFSVPWRPRGPGPGRGGLRQRVGVPGTSGQSPGGNSPLPRKGAGSIPWSSRGIHGSVLFHDSNAFGGNPVEYWAECMPHPI